MADIDLATKAPENDVATQNVPSDEAPLQSSARLGEHCVSDRPTRKLWGFPVYGHANNLVAIGAAPSGETTRIADVDVGSGLTF
jgi:hypothetical protein